jgi:hypothetical protein
MDCWTALWISRLPNGLYCELCPSRIQIPRFQSACNEFLYASLLWRHNGVDRYSAINHVMVVSELDKVLVCYLAWWNIKMFAVLIGRSGDRIPLGARFSAPVLTALGLHNILFNRYRLSFRGVKRPASGFDHSTPSSADVKERVELYIYSPSGTSWPVLGWAVPWPFPVLVSQQHRKGLRQHSSPINNW